MSRDQSPKIYLSGPIEYAHDGGLDWRAIAEASLTEAGFRVFNPCSASAELLKSVNQDLTVESYNEMKKKIDSNFQEFQVYRDATRAIIDRDVRELRTSDIVLVKISSLASGGTSGELTLANHLHIPIVAFCEEPINLVSGWVLSLPDELFAKNWNSEHPLDRALSFLTKHYLTAINSKDELRGAWIS